MTKNIVVCCDGTWNTPEHMDHGLPSPTNVVKLYNALIQDKQQEVYYHPGVGTGRNWWDKIAGGGTGEGLDQNIKSAYRWLGTHYAAGDRIFLFGFSRGAYTVRSLGGLIAKCDLLDLSAQMTPAEVWKRTDEIFAAYRKGVEFANPNGYAFHKPPPGQAAKETTPIHFIGVWDTVGALGIPNDLALLGLFDSPANYRFHDTALSHMVANARHAVALDERRASFAPTLWSTVNAGKTDLKQYWFPGVHCDVGGGYAETGLSDRALLWMMTEAEDCGLRFRATAKKQLHPDPRGVLHDSYTGVFKALKSQPRSAPPIPKGKAILDESTIERNGDPPLTQGDYWVTTLLGANESRAINIYAVEHWNRSGLYLEKGATYEFSAIGEWVDHKDRFTPAGREAAGFNLGDLVRGASSLLGQAENFFKDATGREADFWWTRRDEDAPWFALMGFVANDFGEDAKTLAHGETFMIGEKATLKPKLGGYLYCYANDAWQAYGNNRGSVELTVTRTA
jgi:T6SS, Phospholipase effector Tle1-like, catalytic domain